MKITIEIVDEYTRRVTFEDGMVLTVMRAWVRMGGQGWQAQTPQGIDDCYETHRSIRAAAIAGRQMIVHQDERRRLLATQRARHEASLWTSLISSQPKEQS